MARRLKAQRRVGMRSRVLSEGTYLCVLPEDLCNDNVSMRKA